MKEEELKNVYVAGVEFGALSFPCVIKKLFILSKWIYEPFFEMEAKCGYTLKSNSIMDIVFYSFTDEN